MRAFARNPHVERVEKIGVHPIYAEPNDPYYANPPAIFPNDHWHYSGTYGIDAHLAWDTETGSPSVVVAVADSGVRYFHSDLGGSDPNSVQGRLRRPCRHISGGSRNASSKPRPQAGTVRASSQPSKSVAFTYRASAVNWI